MYSHFRFVIPVVILFVAQTIGGPSFAQNPPITGTAVLKFEPLDQAVLEFMKLIGCQAAAVAVSKDNKPLYSRGYGWRDSPKKQPTQPGTLMRIASVVKPITAAATKMLIRDDKLTLDTKVIEFLKLRPPSGVTPDPRLAQITVDQLLEHKGGWDRNASFDPMFKTRDVEKYLRLRRPAKPVDVIRYMLAQPLQFDPGERSEYSNFGYCVLGRVIEKASGMSYGEYIQQELCKPIGIEDIKLARNLPRARDPREVWYPVPDVLVEVMDSHGGLIASAPALCTFLDHYWNNGEPRSNQYGDWTFFGSLPGTTAMARQRMDGYNIAVLCNSRRDRSYNEDDAQLQTAVDEAIDKMAKASSKKKEVVGRP